MTKCGLYSFQTPDVGLYVSHMLYMKVSLFIENIFAHTFFLR